MIWDSWESSSGTLMNPLRIRATVTGTLNLRWAWSASHSIAQRQSGTHRILRINEPLLDFCVHFACKIAQLLQHENIPLPAEG